MRLFFKQRFFSWFDSYDIYDEQGRTVYTVKGQLAWGHCLKIFDAAGNEIGTVQERGRGYGSEALRQMVNIIHEKHPEVQEIFIDPEKANHRAVRCYEKAGFQTTGEFTGEENALCLMMTLRP